MKGIELNKISWLAWFFQRNPTYTAGAFTSFIESDIGKELMDIIPDKPNFKAIEGAIGELIGEASLFYNTSNAEYKLVLMRFDDRIFRVAAAGYPGGIDLKEFDLSKLLRLRRQEESQDFYFKEARRLLDEKEKTMLDLIKALRGRL